MDTRAALQALSDLKIKSNGVGGKTRAADIRAVNNALIASLVSILDDMGANGGYLGIDLNGIVDITKIKKLISTGQFLKDDGTWSTIPSTTQTIANYTLSGSGQIDLSAYSGNVILKIIDATDQTLNKLLNFSNVEKLTLWPRSGTNLTVNDGSILPFVSIKLAAPTLVLNGSKFGFLELTKRNDGTQDQFFQTNFIDQYV